MQASPGRKGVLGLILTLLRWQQGQLGFSLLEQNPLSLCQELWGRLSSVPKRRGR